MPKNASRKRAKTQNFVPTVVPTLSSYRAKHPEADVYEKQPIKPKNDMQRRYLNAIKNHNIVVSMGVAGSGKTALAAWVAADMLNDPNSPIEKIVVARPAEGKGPKVGFFKGTKEEKLEGWVAPVAEELKKRMGHSRYTQYLECGKIELLSLDQVKGRNHSNCFVIVDEAEDLDVEVAKSLLLRHGKDCKTIINGDIAQQDIKHNSGLAAIIKLMDLAPDRFPGVMIDFYSWDEHCVRSEECKVIGQLWEEFGSKLY